MRTPGLLLLFVAACGGSSTAIDANGDGGGGDDAPDARVIPPACGAPDPYGTGLAPTQTLHVDGTAAPGGDGSAGAPFQSIEQAANAASPGTAIRLAPGGGHQSDQYIDNLRGTEGAPIWIGGDPAQARPVLDGGGEAIHLTRPAYVIVHDLEVRNQTANGINVDDGGALSDETAAHHVTIRDAFIHDVGGSGNQDCIKVSGVNDLFIYDSRIERCGGGQSGSGIDHVGCHRSIVARNEFVSMSGNAVQAKGGSTDVDVRQNRMRDPGERAVNLGGSTGFEFFRPPLSTTAPNAEARRIRAFDNVITGTMATPFGFVGCIDCLVAHNAVSGTPRWAARILQETVSDGTYTFEPSGQGAVINNSFVFDSGTISGETVNVGGNTAPETFTFSHNLWLAADNPSQSTPTLPVAEDGAVIGDGSAYAGLTDPFGAITCSASAPEAGAGVPVPDVPGALDGQCWSAPPPPIGPAICE
jgi:hypothetical protein